MRVPNSPLWHQLLRSLIDLMHMVWFYSSGVLTWKVHDDVIKWRHFPRYWPFVRGIHRSPVNSPHKGQWRVTLMISLICDLNKRLSKQLWGWWFETPSRSLWRHCNVNSQVIRIWPLKWESGGNSFEKNTPITLNQIICIYLDIK